MRLDNSAGMKHPAPASASGLQSGRLHADCFAHLAPRTTILIFIMRLMAAPPCTADLKLVGSSYSRCCGATYPNLIIMLQAVVHSQPYGLAGGLVSGCKGGLRHECMSVFARALSDALLLSLISGNSSYRQYKDIGSTKTSSETRQQQYDLLVALQHHEYVVETSDLRQQVICDRAPAPHCTLERAE